MNYFSIPQEETDIMNLATNQYFRILQFALENFGKIVIS